MQKGLVITLVVCLQTLLLVLSGNPPERWFCEDVAVCEVGDVPRAHRCHGVLLETGHAAAENTQPAGEVSFRNQGFI